MFNKLFMSKHLQFSIDNPCQENWDEMTDTGKGRYCASCQKQVIDFTGMSDSQLAVFFKKQPEGSICGRLHKDQLDRNIEIPKKRIPWGRYFFQFTLPAFLISMKATALGNVKISKRDTISKREIVLNTGNNCSSLIQPPANMIKINLPLVLTGKSSAELALPEKSALQLVTDERTIRGKIVDDRGKPVAFATVVIKGSHLGTITTMNGVFTITPEKGWKAVILTVSCIGFETTEIKCESNNTDVNIALPVRLQPADMVGLIVTRKPEKKKLSKTIPLLTQKFMDTAFKFFKIFPNPVSAGTSLHIEWKQTEEGYFTFELFDVSEKRFYSKEIWIDREARLLNLEVPSVRAGNYLLRATHNGTGKGFTEKITIQ